MSTFLALRIAGGARCVCILSTVRRTFRSRLGHSRSSGAVQSADALPLETDSPKAHTRQVCIPLAQPYRVDGDPVSSQAESLAATKDRLLTMLARPLWETCWTDITDKDRLAEALNEYWEPFAVDDGRMWLRRLSYVSPVPLPPQ